MLIVEPVLCLFLAMSFAAQNPDQPLPPTTTAQQDVTTAGQRKINLIWEFTQAFIAISVVAANLAVGVHVGFSDSKSEVPPLLTNSLFLVIGFYFSRTNHAAIGGTGTKPSDDYHGR